MVQVILRQAVDDLGDIGEVVDVRPGYARNFLIPQGIAYEANDANQKRFEEERRHILDRSARELDRAKAASERIEGQSVSFTMRAGEEGKLFGSVTASDISEALAEKGLEVDRHLIRLEEPIKQLGVYRVSVRLHAEVRPEVTVWVVAEGDAES
ncbi:MAG: 50S ribosomal protein L9 [Gemmatimonadetes bacterium]|nr:50S ribosomal protein L9 [Gemmatimonadota bacterium]MCK5484229.1 50S ribosomal protein L9 [Gemmatimonadota bacterium]